MEFEWDDAKRARNLQLHSVGFDEAEETFFDPLALMTSDEGHSCDEDRFRLLGRSRRNRLLITIFTWRGDKIRIISSWRATRREVKGYEERI